MKNVHLIPTEKSSENCLSKRVRKCSEEDIIGELTIVDNPYFIEAFNDEGINGEYEYYFTEYD